MRQRRVRRSLSVETGTVIIVMSIPETDAIDPLIRKIQEQRVERFDTLLATLVPGLSKPWRPVQTHARCDDA